MQLSNYSILNPGDKGAWYWDPPAIFLSDQSSAFGRPLYYDLRLSGDEHIRLQQLISQLAVEAFNLSVLPGAVRLDEQHRHTNAQATRGLSSP